MAAFRVLVEKSQFGEFWSNRYFVEAATLAAAADKAEEIANIENNVYPPHTIVSKVRVDDLNPQTDNFITRQLDLAGGRAATSPDMPLFVCWRVDLAVSAGGRPDRKFLKGVQHSDSSGGGITAASRAFVDAQYVQPLLALAGLISGGGGTYTGGTVLERAGMRQLRRGSRRRATPIIP
jgi:hypothetical protein